MRLNKASYNGYHYINDLNVVLSNSFSKGIGDSLGRTARAAIIYDENREELIKGIKSYFYYCRTSPETGSHVYVTRYVGDDVRDYLRGNSRDHVLKTMAILKELNEDEFVKWYLDNRAKRPCIDHPFTINQKLMLKALYSKTWSWILLLIELPYLLFTLLTNFLFRTLSWTHKTYKNPTEFFEADLKPMKERSLWRRVCYKCVLPTFASFYTIIIINSIESKSVKKTLQFVMKFFFEKHNYVGRALCGQKVKYPKGYVPSRKNRWSIRLDAGCNRDMTPQPNDISYNNMEMGGLEYYCEK